ncbi:MAG: serine/threonine-protein kinase [Synechococcus sp.]|nr:serine/threonine-protein kinase [Synechococcus sp.]
MQQSICLNPACVNVNPIQHNFCSQCRTPLVLKDRYRAIKILGQGGFGRTFLATDEDLPSKPFRVIKQFLPQAQGTATIKKAEELFEAEAIQLDRLGSQHDQIPSLFAHFTVDQRQYLIQEFIDGPTLADELKVGVFTQEQVKAVLLDILPILQFIHGQNVIHRDIKPENIIRRQSDQKLVLVDFGAAKQMTANLSVVGTVISSYGYAAPEQEKGKAQYASDLYSLGVTCLELLTGVEPTELFDVNGHKWIWRDFLNDNEVDNDLGDILDKLVQPALNRRYQNAEDALPHLGGSGALELFSENSVKQNNTLCFLDELDMATLKAMINYFEEMPAKIRHYHRDHNASSEEAEVIAGYYLKVAEFITTIQTLQEIDVLIEVVNRLKKKISRYQHKSHKYRWSTGLDKNVLDKLEKLKKSL